MIKKFNQIIALVLGTKVMMWAVPDSKRFIKGILITLAVVLLTIYFHNEYLSWSEISGNSEFISQCVKTSVERFFYYQIFSVIYFKDWFCY